MNINENQNESQNQTGPETWVPEAVAEQEEHLKRARPCQDTQEHAYRDFGRPGRGGIIRAALWRECLTCGVTETPEDYRKRLGSELAE
jgi:hypothetical protein